MPKVPRCIEKHVDIGNEKAGIFVVSQKAKICYDSKGEEYPIVSTIANCLTEKVVKKHRSNQQD